MQVTGKEIVAEILNNMKVGLEPLHYTTLAPSIFHVSLRRDDFERLHTVFPFIQEEAIQALDNEVLEMNDPPWFVSVTRRLTRPRRRWSLKAAGDWEIDFNIDEDGDLANGEFAVRSELARAAPPEYGAGEGTIKAPVNEDDPPSDAPTLARGQSPKPGQPFAKVQFVDDSGKHTFFITSDVTMIGRGGPAHAVDLKLATLPDVSRQHISLRRDAVSGKFYLRSLSSMGTTVDGKEVPSPAGRSGATDGAAEIMLGEKTRIGLAEAVFLDFEYLKDEPHE
jgi:hypothetical protein